MKNLGGALEIWGGAREILGVREKFGGCMKKKYGVDNNLWTVHKDSLWTITNPYIMYLLSIK
jgi:hypothetical protein